MVRRSSGEIITNWDSYEGKFACLIQRSFKAQMLKYRCACVYVYEESK